MSEKVSERTMVGKKVFWIAMVLTMERRTKWAAPSWRETLKVSRTVLCSATNWALLKKGELSGQVPKWSLVGHLFAVLDRL